MSQQELELPQGWTEATIGDMIAFDGLFNDGDWVETKDQDSTGKVRLIQLADIKKFEFKIKSNRFMNKMISQKLKCTFLKKNDILIARMPDPLGRACIFTYNEMQCVTVVDVGIIRMGDNGVFSDWLMWIINSPQIRSIIEQNQTGTTRKRITRKNLNKINFYVPPQNEQKRIVSKIEEIFSKIDSAKQSLEHTKLQLKLYENSFQDKIFKKLESKYELEKLQDVCIKITDGTHHSPKNTPQAEMPYITAKNIRPRKLNLTNLTYISQEDHNKIYARCNPVQGDVLYTKDGVNLGMAVVNELDFEFSLLSSVALLKPKHEILNNFYLMAFLNNPSCFSLVTKKSLGSAITRIVLRQIKEIPIPLPPLEEQEQIVSQIEQGFSLIENTSQIVESSLQNLQTMKMSVLKQAFEGKLVPQDPNDESASVLLEKIKLKNQT